MPAMRIVCLTHTPELYGANLSMFAWLSELRKRGHEFLIIGPHGPIEKECVRLGVPFHAFQPSWWAAEPRALHRAAVFRSLIAARLGHRTLAARIAQFHPDCLYSNSAVMPQGSQLAKRLRIPHVWHLREFLDLDFGYSAALGWPLTCAAFARATATISVSHAVQKHLIPNPRCCDVVIHEGVATRKQFLSRARAGEIFPNVSPTAPFSFVLVGMLQPNKGHHLAIRSLAALAARGHKARLLLVGGGPSGSLRELAATLGVADSVAFAGHLTDPAPAVLASHAALTFSRAEAFGRTTIEAMSLGRPVIALRSGASPELITHNETGLLCDDTPESTSAAMARLIETPSLAAILGRAAAHAAQSYCNENYADSMEQLFRKIAPTVASIPHANSLRHSTSL